MRRTWMIVGLLVALAVPASAEAGHRTASPRNVDDGDCEVPVRGGWITVDNPNHKELEVLVDGRLAGKLGAGDEAQFGPYRAGRHVVETRYVCNKEHLNTTVSEQTVNVRGRRGAFVRADYSELGLFAVKNTWVEPMSLAIDGRRSGSVQPGKTMTVLAPTGAQIRLRAPGGQIALTARASARGLAGQRARFVAPRVAYVDVYNPARVALKVVDASTGEPVCAVGPGRTERLELTSGYRKLKANFRSRGVDSIALIATPWGTKRWNIELPRTASLTIRNDNPLDVRAYADGRFLGSIDAGDQVAFANIAVGRVEVTLKANGRRGGVSTTTTASVSPLMGGSVSPQLALHDGRNGSDRRHRHVGREYDRHAERAQRRRVSWRWSMARW